jgi:GDP-L-fucose synthase
MKKIFVCGHTGMVGSAIVRALEASDCPYQLVTATRRDVDLLNQSSVLRFFEKNHIDEIYLAAGKVGGILANSMYPVDFLTDNLLIQLNVINSAHKVGVKRILNLGSSCIYPRDCQQPIKEEYLLSGTLEKTNEAYAIAKIAGMKLCGAYMEQFAEQDLDYRCLMPCNLYGPGDLYDLQNSHVVPALIRKFHEAKLENHSTVSIWGSGRALREFLHVDDLAEACLFFMNISRSRFWDNLDSGISFYNIGTGRDVSIQAISELIGKVVGFTGEVKFDNSKPDGTPRKCLDVSRANKVGWSASTPLIDGLYETYKSFCSGRARIS